MSIILRALKKIQEQEAGQAINPISGETAPSEKDANAAPNDQISEHPMRPYVEVPRHSFGFGLKALLGLLVVLGIATTGWFAKSFYSNLQAGPEIAKKEISAVAKEPAKPIQEIPAVVGKPEKPKQEIPAIVEDPEKPAQVEAPTPAPAEPQPIEAAPVPAPAAVEEPEDPQPEPLIEAATSAPHISAAPVAEPVQPPPPLPTTVLEVPVVESPGSPPSVPEMKEAKPARPGRPEFKINAIAWKSKEPRAIVNMQRIYEGDVIEGATVVAIKRKIVVFEYDGEIFEVRF
jgi:hypothetical protein